MASEIKRVSEVEVSNSTPASHTYTSKQVRQQEQVASLNKGPLKN